MRQRHDEYTTDGNQGGTVVLIQIAQEAPGFDWTPVFEVLRDALTVVVPAVVTYIVFLLRKNQQTTEEAKSEARQAKNTATEANDTVQRIQEAQVNLGELDALRRFKSAFDTIASPEGKSEIYRFLSEGKSVLRASDSELTRRLIERYSHPATPPEAKP